MFEASLFVKGISAFLFLFNRIRYVPCFNCQKALTIVQKSMIQWKK